MPQKSMEISKDFLDWDKPFTAEQLRCINEEFDLVQTLDELIETIRIADEWIADEDDCGPHVCGGSVSSPFGEDESFDVCHVDCEYSSDAFGLATSTVLSAKSLRVQIEKIIGVEEAKLFYQRLLKAFGFFETVNGGYTIMKADWPVPHSQHNPAASLCAAFIEQRYTNYLEEEDYVFHKKGDFWLVTFQGQSNNIKDTVGMSHIHRLLEKPNQHISAHELSKPKDDGELRRKGKLISSEQLDDEVVTTDLDSSQELVKIEKPMLEKFHERLAEIKVEIAEAKANNDSAKIMASEDDKEKIIDYLKMANQQGNLEECFADGIEKVRKRVLIAIKRVLKNIEQHNIALYYHLKNSIQTGDSCKYTPEKPIPWEL